MVPVHGASNLRFKDKSVPGTRELTMVPAGAVRAPEPQGAPRSYQDYKKRRKLEQSEWLIYGMQESVARPPLAIGLHLGNLAMAGWTTGVLISHGGIDDTSSTFIGNMNVGEAVFQQVGLVTAAAAMENTHRIIIERAGGFTAKRRPAAQEQPQGFLATQWFRCTTKLKQWGTQLQQTPVGSKYMQVREAVGAAWAVAGHEALLSPTIAPTAMITTAVGLFATQQDYSVDNTALQFMSTEATSALRLVQNRNMYALRAMHDEMQVRDPLNAALVAHATSLWSALSGIQHDVRALHPISKLSYATRPLEKEQHWVTGFPFVVMDAVQDVTGWPEAMVGSTAINLGLFSWVSALKWQDDTSLGWGNILSALGLQMLSIVNSTYANRRENWLADSMLVSFGMTREDIAKTPSEKMHRFIQRYLLGHAVAAVGQIGVALGAGFAAQELPNLGDQFDIVNTYTQFGATQFNITLNAGQRELLPKISMIAHEFQKKRFDTANLTQFIWELEAVAAANNIRHAKFEAAYPRFEAVHSDMLEVAFADHAPKWMSPDSKFSKFVDWFDKATNE